MRTGKEKYLSSMQIENPFKRVERLKRVKNIPAATPIRACRPARS